MKTITLHINGAHCHSCKILIEDILNEQDGIENVLVNLKQETVSFETELRFNNEELAEMLSEKVQPNGYTFSVEKKQKTKKDHEMIWRALPIGLAFLALFFLLQKSGILQFGIGGNLTPTTSFLIGLVASVSSCLAVVGGLVLSLSATVSQNKEKNTRTMIFFHGGRLFGFSLFGGVLGALGQAIGLNFTAGAILGILASGVMIILGLHLVGVFEKSTITLPSGIFSFFRKTKRGIFAPFFLGIGTFFLPCGFTQAMQIAALSSGSFVSGLFLMLAFAIGTFPVLAFLSFGSASFARGKNASLFFMSSGVVVLGLGIFTLITGLVGLGLRPPFFSL